MGSYLGELSVLSRSATIDLKRRSKDGSRSQRGEKVLLDGSADGGRGVAPKNWKRKEMILP